MTRRLATYLPLLLLFLVLAGCTPATTPIDPNNGVWDKYFVGPLAEVLDWFAAKLWEQYGLSILVVTVIIRLIILPLTLKQYKSSKRMQELQPELKKLKDKYKDDPKKQQEETMKLFQSNGVNPLAGCFPLIVQMPILIALYNAIMRNHHIGEHSFLWMQLGTKDPYYILPLCAALTTFFQQKMMKTQMNPQMQSLMFIFPVLIFVMAMNFASALPLYWVYSNLFTIVQSYFIYGGSQNKVGQSK
ncbi:membrane protein insertase YidC [Paenibacillus doosanensis]|uniref:Membrane protein insertase YidC n=1 Tax=Paenibacillus konkukensis TaxID=2020716 RepID=A0ABY4RPW1_9BACL|nr:MULTISPECIES: membrane protein insertase YidC [Paenibacillus]MCS7463114.1 membrane protein insertase YidC [Paenibacillus doosanensis]UQZ84492.1 Membrane protein insertase MisCA precursor [Paenibacillus konkukensis]